VSTDMTTRLNRHSYNYIMKLSICRVPRLSEDLHYVEFYAKRAASYQPIP
jgi:hypothetical protein